ncbi:MAG: hypothetical protein AB1545_00565 [Thermodesulfobacteriota bacterium]
MAIRSIFLTTIATFGGMPHEHGDIRPGGLHDSHGPPLPLVSPPFLIIGKHTNIADTSF